MKSKTETLTAIANELQSLAKYINPDDVLLLLLQWADVPEHTPSSIVQNNG